ncbi:MAG: hypothetical protein ACNA8W_14055 [Bradymonadaceae bacterium]
MRRTTNLPKMKGLPPPKKKIDQAKEVIEQAKEANRDGAVTAMILHHTITLVILSLLIAMGFWSYVTFSTTDFFADVDRMEYGSRMEPYLVEAQRQRITAALEVSYRIHDRYPTTLQGLVEAGLLLPSDLYYPAGRTQWEYRRQDQMYQLTHAKPEPHLRDD